MAAWALNTVAPKSLDLTGATSSGPDQRHVMLR
jgi:hypothetical protein